MKNQTSSDQPKRNETRVIKSMHSEKSFHKGSQDAVNEKARMSREKAKHMEKDAVAENSDSEHFIPNSENT